MSRQLGLFRTHPGVLEVGKYAGRRLNFGHRDLDLRGQPLCVGVAVRVNGAPPPGVPHSGHAA